MIRKVSGKNKKSECVHIKSSNGNMCCSTKHISNSLGENFQKNCSSSNYEVFMKIAWQLWLPWQPFMKSFK